MSGIDPPDGDFPFFDINSLFAGQGGGDPWSNTRRIAASIANQGGTEPNLDPLIRIDYENLARIAELQVAQGVGPSLPSATTVVAVSKTEWVEMTVDLYRPLFERFGEALSSATEIQPIEEASDPFTAMFGQMFQALGPLLVSTSAGSMIGQLGLNALGQYDLPVPRQGDKVLIVGSEIDKTAEEWDVPVDELRLWVLIHELNIHAVLSVPHVHRQLEGLLIDFAGAFSLNLDAINEQFGAVGDLEQMQQMASALNDPDVVLGLLRSPAQDLLVPQLDALVAAILGFAAHRTTSITTNLVSSHDTITNKFHERLVGASPADRVMERLLGIEITEHTLNRGEKFIQGIAERADDSGLDRLWANELDLPTAAEVDAPGLWLARIGLDPDTPAATLDVPDDLSGLDEL